MEADQSNSPLKVCETNISTKMLITLHLVKKMYVHIILLHQKFDYFNITTKHICHSNHYV